MPQSQFPEIYSDLAGDPDLTELVEMFVEEMPERIGRMVSSWETRDLPALARLAHQLKGSAGSYGFHEITPYATQLESIVKNGGTEEGISHDLQQLVGICQQVRNGQPIDAVAAEAV